MGLIGTVLAVIGGVLVLTVVLVFVVLAMLRARLRRWAEMVGTQIEGMGAATPSRITLQRLANQSAADLPAMMPSVEQLRDLGFEDAGLWGIAQIPQVRMAALVDTRHDVYGVVYEHEAAGVWVDLVTRYEDGTSVTYSTTPHAGTLDERPGHHKVAAPELDARALYQRFLAERPEGATEAAAAEIFAENFERAYAEEMDWRNARGGPTADEIRRVAALSGEEYDDDAVEATRSLQAAQANLALEYALRERFTEETTLTVAQWDEVEDRLLFIHDGMDDDTLHDIVVDWTDEDPDEYPVSGDTPRARFAALNERLPEDARFRLVGAVSRPVEADVYAAPAGSDEW